MNFEIKLRHTLAIIPALIFWAVGLIFFVMGLSMHDQTGYLLYIAIGLAIANTIIQLIGWDSEPEELGSLLYMTWLASYVLGIGTGVVSLLFILQGIDNTVLRWIVSGALSFMIEVTPERLFILAYRSIRPKRDGSNSGGQHQGGESRRREHQGHTQLGRTPQGKKRREYVQEKAQELAQQKAAAVARQNGGQQKQKQGQQRFSGVEGQPQSMPRTSRENQVAELFDLEDNDEDEFEV